MHLAALVLLSWTRTPRKSIRRFYGHVGSGAIKFASATDTLNIGEGIESTLSGAVLGYTPTWCVGSASGIARLPVIADVSTLHIFGEKDDNDANAKAVKTLKARWRNSADIYVIEPEIGDDLNDALRGAVTP